MSREPTTLYPKPRPESVPIDLSRVDVPKTRRLMEEVLRKQVAQDTSRLVELATQLGVEVAMLPDLSCNCCDCRDPKRPNFGPMQVRHLCQIKKGLTYQIINRNIFDSLLYCVGAGVPFTILRAPYQASYGLLIDARVHNVNGIYKTSVPLARISVTPGGAYGDWETAAWLSFTEDSEHLAGPHKDHCSCCRHHYRENQ